VKRQTQSRDEDAVLAAVAVSDAFERSPTFIVTVKPPSATGLLSRRSSSGPMDTDVKSAAGSFVVGGSGLGARSE